MAISSRKCFDRSPILQLSQELIDEIIDNATELRDLKSLSLVCRVFRPRCEKYIFTSISFRSQTTKRIHEFIDILSRKPYIAGYPRELRLHVEERDQEWIVEDSGFLKIMGLIRQSAASSPLKKFELTGDIIRWNKNKITSPRRFAESFCAPFITPFLSSLCLKDLDDVPLTLVAECSQLKTLDLTRTTFGGLELVKPVNTSQSYPKLHVLHFDRCDRGLDTLLQRRIPGSCPLLNFSELRIIETDPILIENVEYLNELMPLLSGSLEELYLKFKKISNEEYEDLSEWINFSALSHLRVLHVDVLFPPAQDNANIITDVCKALNTISSSNVLEELTIRLFIGFFWRVPPSAVEKRGNWAFLDDEVQRLSSGKPLKFHLCLLYNLPYEWDSDEDCTVWDDPGLNGSCYSALQELEDLYEETSLCETTFRKMVDVKLPMIRSDPNIVFELTIDPDYSQAHDSSFREGCIIS